MSVTVFRRPARRREPEMPSGELSLQEPPVLPEALGGNLSMVLTVVPMAVASGAMMVIFIVPMRAGGGIGSLMPVAMGLMMLAMVFMSFAQYVRSASERRSRMRGERRDYLRYLGQIRKQVRTAADAQRATLSWRHPDPAVLWSVTMGGRLWERRLAHADFAEVRISRCSQRLALTITRPQTKPIEDLEPLTARACAASSPRTAPSAICRPQCSCAASATCSSAATRTPRAASRGHCWLSWSPSTRRTTCGSPYVRRTSLPRIGIG